MQIKVNVSLDFLNGTPAEKLVKGEEVVTGIPTQSARLPNLPFLVSVLITLNADLKDAVKTAAGGGHAAVSAKNDMIAKWDDAYKLTALYVNSMANGDKTFILATGFDATSDERVSRGNVEVLDSFTATPAPTGSSVELDSAKQANAQGVLMIVAPQGVAVKKVGEAVLITIGTSTVYVTVNTHHGATVHGLTAGQLMSAFGLAFNLNGMGPISKTGNDFTPQQ